MTGNGACRGGLPSPGPSPPHRGGGEHFARGPGDRRGEGAALRGGRRSRLRMRSARMHARESAQRTLGRCSRDFNRLWPPVCRTDVSASGRRCPARTSGLGCRDPPDSRTSPNRCPHARCVRDARPEGREPAGRARRDIRRRTRAPAEMNPPGPGAVGNGGIVAYGARSPVRRPGAEHARTRCSPSKPFARSKHDPSSSEISSAAARDAAGPPAESAAGRTAWRDIRRTRRRGRACRCCRTDAR